MLRFAVIGAGAVAELAYLPALTGQPAATVDAVVDIDETRAERVGTAFDARVATTRYQDILKEIDAAIIATPPSTHAKITRDCLTQDVAVLTEKPVATTSEEADELVRLAADRDLPFAISRQLRESPVTRLVRLFTHTGALGPLEGFSMQYGDETNWAFASEYRVRKSLSWGGVLTDKAPHALDALLWIFGDDVSVDRYEDDSLGGIEANATVRLSFTDRDIDGALRVTASRNLPNRLTVRGRDGVISGDPKDAEVTIRRPNGEESRIQTNDLMSLTDYRIRIAKQTHHFVESIENHTEPAAPAETGVPVVSLIESCYACRETRLESWEQDLRSEVN